MTTERVQEVARFDARDEEDVTYKVIEYKRLTHHEDLGGSRWLTKPFWELLDGTPLDQIDAETFEIRNTNKRIRKL